GEITHRLLLFASRAEDRASVCVDQLASAVLHIRSSFRRPSRPPSSGWETRRLQQRGRATRAGPKSISAKPAAPSAGPADGARQEPEAAREAYGASRELGSAPAASAGKRPAKPDPARSAAARGSVRPAPAVPRQLHKSGNPDPRRLAGRFPTAPGNARGPPD